jgi:hypothetical protein
MHVNVEFVVQVAASRGPLLHGVRQHSEICAEIRITLRLALQQCNVTMKSNWLGWRPCEWLLGESSWRSAPSKGGKVPDQLSDCKHFNESPASRWDKVYVSGWVVSSKTQCVVVPISYCLGFIVLWALEMILPYVCKIWGITTRLQDLGYYHTSARFGVLPHGCKIWGITTRL